VKKSKLNRKKSSSLNNKTISQKTIVGNSKNKKIALFIIKFFFIFFLLSFIVEILPLGWLNELIAQVSSSLVGLSAKGAIINIDGFNFIVGNACTGLMSASILAATIFSLAKPSIKKKLMLFTIGLGILLIVNIPRVSLVLLFAKYGFDANLVHELTWFVMSGVILLIWYYGTKKVCEIKDFSELI